jgi:SAM-dependent methyltransferase
MNRIHPSAAQGFGAAAETYVRGRPDYPAGLLPWLTRELGLEPGRTGVDLGAGTGKFTRLLAGTGAELIAVEPVAAMREQLQAALPGIRAVAGSAEAMPLAPASVDAVVCAQAFHWFSTAEALAEIHRVLRPGGRLGLVWNVRDESVDWVAALTEIISPFEAGSPRYRTGLWRRAFDGQPFTPLEETCFPNEHVGPPQAVIVDRCLSVSFIAKQPPAARAEVEAAIRELIATHPDLRGRETVRFPYSTRAFRCMRQ